MSYYKYNQDTMSYSRVRIAPYIITGALCVLLLSMTRDDKDISYETPPMIMETYVGGEEPFSFEAFKQFVLDCKIKFPEVVLAQAVQESRFNSGIWKENHNPFGMKVAKSRNTTNIGENRGHAEFKNWRMAVIDYAYMQAVFARKIKTRAQYFIYLKNYAEDENYDQKLKKIIRQYKGFGICSDYLYIL